MRSCASQTARQFTFILMGIEAWIYQPLHAIKPECDRQVVFMFMSFAERSIEQTEHPGLSIMITLDHGITRLRQDSTAWICPGLTPTHLLTSARWQPESIALCWGTTIRVA